uniref:Plastid light harvesting protein n=1 Tax=Chaetoceros debilis TaxID=122233 RepID=A0A7S3PV12_9STRA|eukprot:CAMPEP_0194074688 /NCGR_PEP_ID=MMETSP0149-20130528/1781_1 /TAXON_ID=122233 /ORGANISM="Chaetoceros debilis, Strain MM31A-1" /LENGTH=212 /DNA_ID=CAMNT_0038754941 /DNA_START=74 /DNA_END=712 /DNA_ORIENTATION=+
MTKLSLALSAALVASATAFAPAPSAKAATSVAATGFEEVGGVAWDPLSLGKLEDANDTFPNMFPKSQYLQEAEIKHGRMSMLAWTGVWATHVGGMGLGMHISGMPIESDWTKALGVVAAEQPALFGAILLFISVAEGESVGHSGDNWRNMSTKEPGNLGFDISGLGKKMSEEEAARYKIVELKNGRAAMIAMASLFAMESIPGSVPLMDVFN